MPDLAYNRYATPEFREDLSPAEVEYLNLGAKESAYKRETLEKLRRPRGKRKNH